MQNADRGGSRRLGPIRYAHSGQDDAAAGPLPDTSLPGPGATEPVPVTPAPASRGPVNRGPADPGPADADADAIEGVPVDSVPADATAGLVYEAPQPSQPLPPRPEPPAEPPELAEPKLTEPEPGEPEPAGRGGVTDEGLGIFGGVKTVEVPDDDSDRPPPERHQLRRTRPPAMDPPVPPPAPGQAGQAPGPAAGAAWNQPVASPSAASEPPPPESRPRSFAAMRGRLRGGGGTPGWDSEPRVSVRDLPPDVQVRFWRIRLTIMVVVGAVFGILFKSWELGLTLAILAGIVDTVYRSRNAHNYKNGSHPGARKRTRKQLNRMRREGYFALDARAIPGSREMIDHLVVGPTGVYAIDSEIWDKKLPIRTLNGKRLYLGPESQKERLDHAVWEAGQASELLSATLGYQVPVRPALAIFGPKVPWDIATIREVDVFTGASLRKYLKRRGRRKDGVVPLTREQVRTIFDTASRVLPDVAPSRAYSPVG